MSLLHPIHTSTDILQCFLKFRHVIYMCIKYSSSIEIKVLLTLLRKSEIKVSYIINLYSATGKKQMEKLFNLNSLIKFRSN